MSKSRSPSPPHNRLSLNIVQSPTPSTTSPSRPETLERHIPVYREPLTVRLSPTPQGTQPAESSSQQSPTHRKRPAEVTSDDPMAKRIRRDFPMERGRVSGYSDPLSDSQDEMADSEMDSQKTQRQEQLPLTSAPQKKKRTRTLTTPHQSAVLHALLAQSRFPTTAMREEVGRSIGLSARKVQIWFQNQRQKARRPRSQSDAPAVRPHPQYGAFSTATEAASHGSQREYGEYGTNAMSYRRQHSPEARPGSMEMPARLLGPGMPGAPAYPPQTYRQLRSPSVSAPPTESRFPMPHSYQRALSPPPYTSPRMYPMPGARPATSQPRSWRERDPSRTLPPLVSTRPATLTFGGRRNYTPGEPPYPLPRTSFTSPRSISPEPRFAHLPPDPILRSSVNLPPPFTLQPSPQWDESSYTPFPRPSTSPWTRPTSHSSRGRSTSPVMLRREHIGTETSDSHYLAEYTSGPANSSPRSMPSTSTPLSRTGRYDPVRATFVPYTTPSPGVSPVHTARGDGADERTDNDVFPVHEDR
ncbi:hypothetical protein D9613_009464 [Agrocybe pediades]|uniref:Homeobox domain-containing protein n=1 Tax=Agrocybe pediades TaxID=84607 RepID=A0A8H4R4Q0_9AGAR|nr:hypothetical protein D9613_009464 [Agrocybe pediades]